MNNKAYSFIDTGHAHKGCLTDTEYTIHFYAYSHQLNNLYMRVSV